ncbi:MAG TPA: glycosyltransferase, partial [Candidatus Methanoperedens sp.]|nr:glycosyltransferase [Candidatus Methanoperedens sp.]
MSGMPAGPIRVLYLIDTLEIGGAEKSLLDILPRLEGVEPVLCHLYPGPALRRAYERAGIAVVSLDLPGRYAFLRAIRAVRGVVRDHRPDLIHSTLLRSDLVARAVGTLAGIPVVGSFVSEGRSRRSEGRCDRLLAVKGFAVHLLDRLTARRVAAFVANSGTAKASNCRALGVPEAKVRVLYRGRDASVFHPAGEGSRRAGDGAQPPVSGVPVLTCVGRLREAKGHGDVIRAMPRVLARFPGAQLVIRGEGPARAGLEALVDELRLRLSVALP